MPLFNAGRQLVDKGAHGEAAALFLCRHERDYAHRRMAWLRMPLLPRRFSEGSAPARAYYRRRTRTSALDARPNTLGLSIQRNHRASRRHFSPFSPAFRVDDALPYHCYASKASCRNVRQV